MITIDFETYAIQGNPLLTPPEPIGVSIKEDDRPSVYYTGDDMLMACREAWGSEEPLLFHNAPFDLSVARTHFGLEFPNWERIHDTQYLLFLADPHAKSLSLKASGERVLGRSPAEQDELHDWILANVPGSRKSNAGAFIHLAPHGLVARYAKQDTDLTKALYDRLVDRVPPVAYNVERELMPYLTAATVKGVRTDRVALKGSQYVLEVAARSIDASLHDMLGDINLDSGADLAEALETHGLITEWKLTPTGKRSTAKDSLLAGINDEDVLSLLLYRGALTKMLSSFIIPWIAQSESDGRLHPNWNQTRSSREKDRGTRTGRLSSDSPNFQNVSKPYKGPVPAGFPELPELRKFILPEVGEEWLSRDFCAQEMRILAHFEDGLLLEQFQDNPDMDPHLMIKNLIRDKTGMDVSRDHVKGVGFGIMYGMGVAGLATQLGVSVEQAGHMRSAYHAALPGVGALQHATRGYGKRGLPVVTSGGREYLVEPPRIMNNDMRTFEYKLLNYLIQGSAADQTKCCLLDWFKCAPSEHTFLATVHDEINISVPIGDQAIQLERCMENTTMDCPMRTTVERGPTWGELK